MTIGGAVLSPGRYSRADALRRRGRDVGFIVMGAVVMLFVAALLEGFFRQLVTNITVRYLVASSSLVLLVLYFGWAGRRRWS